MAVVLAAWPVLHRLWHSCPWFGPWRFCLASLAWQHKTREIKQAANEVLKMPVCEPQRSLHRDTCRRCRPGVICPAAEMSLAGLAQTERAVSNCILSSSVSPIAWFLSGKCLVCHAAVLPSTCSHLAPWDVMLNSWFGVWRREEAAVVSP